jgi:ABC-type Zn2+ transport system substrate-binding protein/surface adhesin
MINDIFRENVIQQCRRCTIRDECELDKSTGFCPLEESVYEDFMNALEEEYESVTRIQRLLAEQLITNLILANRVSRHIKIKGDMNNNKNERFNGEIRDREKVVRRLKTVDTPILKGYQIFHNYIRPHEAVERLFQSRQIGHLFQSVL